MHVQQENSAREAVEVWVSTDYLKGMKIDDVSPPPDSSESSQGGTLYTFLATHGDLEASFDLTGNNVGLLEGSIGVGGPGDTADFSQFSYP